MKKSILLYLSISLVVFLVCSFIFISNYGVAYNNSTGGGFIPYSFAVIWYYFIVIVISTIIAGIIKVILQKDIKLINLLSISIILPILNYNILYYALKQDGPFNFLVEEGGVFNFIKIGDYNFDGVNDTEHMIMTKERTVPLTTSMSLQDDIDYVDGEITGIGRLTSVFVDIPSDRTYFATLHYGGNVKINKLTINFKLTGNNFNERSKLFIDSYDNTAIEYDKIGDNTIRITLYGDLFEKFNIGEFNEINFILK